MSDQTWRQYPPKPVVVVGAGNMEGEGPASLPVTVAGSAVAESLTDSDAETEVLTFAAPIQSVEVWHAEDDPQEFIINGITITVAAGGWRSPIGGTPSDEVTIPEGVACIVNRLV